MEEAEQERSLERLTLLIPELESSLEKARERSPAPLHPSKPLITKGAQKTHAPAPGTTNQPALDTDVQLYPEFDRIIRKVDAEVALNSVEFRSLVTRYKKKPEKNPRLFDIILDALNPILVQHLEFLISSQESLRFHVQVKPLKDSLRHLEPEVRDPLGRFLVEPENRIDRHPNLGRTAAFELIPGIVKRLLNSYSHRQHGELPQYINREFPRQLTGLLSPEEGLDPISSDEHGLIPVWEQNKQRRQFLLQLAGRLDLPAGQAGQAILIREVEKAYDYLFRKHWYPVYSHRRSLLPESILWDEILKPLLLEFEECSTRFKSGAMRSGSFVDDLRSFLLPRARDRFQALLRDARKNPPVYQTTGPLDDEFVSSDEDIEHAVFTKLQRDRANAIINSLSPRTRAFWDAYHRLQATVAQAHPALRRIEGRVFQAVASELGSTRYHARNKIYEVRRRLEAAGLREPPKPRGKAARIRYLKQGIQ